MANFQLQSITIHTLQTVIFIYDTFKIYFVAVLSEPFAHKGEILSLKNSSAPKNRVYLGVKTCEVFLCFVTIMFVLSFVLTSLFSLFYVTREGDRFLHRG